jgi:hypothetical protein
MEQKTITPPPPESLIAGPLEQYFLKIILLEKTENTIDTMYQRYKKDKKANNDLQNITHKTDDEIMRSEKISSSSYTSSTYRITIVQNTEGPDGSMS